MTVGVSDGRRWTVVLYIIANRKISVLDYVHLDPSIGVPLLCVAVPPSC
jgi:hypothetical protein